MGGMFTRLLGGARALALELVGPSFCVECGVPLGGPALLCIPCGSSVGGPIQGTVGGTPTIALGRYDGPVGTAVRKLKYEGRTDLAMPIAALLAPAIGDLPVEGPCTLIPVPLHPLRLAERGYNQSALLARELGRARGWAVQPRALERSRVTAQQALLPRDRREENTRGAFRLTARVTGAVVLVDDVVTTGATALACGDVLTRGGARVVVIVSVARGGAPARAGSRPG